MRSETVSPGEMGGTPSIAGLVGFGGRGVTGLFPGNCVSRHGRSHRSVGEVVKENISYSWALGGSKWLL